MSIENAKAGTANRKKGEQTGQIYNSTGRSLKGENFRPVTSINTSVLEKRKNRSTLATVCIIHLKMAPFCTRKDQKGDERNCSKKNKERRL